MDTFDWQEVNKIEVDNSEKRIKIYRVEQIFAIEGSSSEEHLEHLEPGHAMN